MCDTENLIAAYWNCMSTLNVKYIHMNMYMGDSLKLFGFGYGVWGGWGWDSKASKFESFLHSRF
jgi:hypothetical protein